MKSKIHLFLPVLMSILSIGCIWIVTDVAYQVRIWADGFYGWTARLEAFAIFFYIESMENYIIIHTLTSKQTVITRLKHILDALPETSFLQVHRSYIVNLRRVQAIEGNQLIIGNDKIPVARPLREQVYRHLLNHHLVGK